VVLRKQDPIQHRGVKLALETFAVCKTENVFCEAEPQKLREMRDENTIETEMKTTLPDHK
jgi:hypothetical protein